MDNHIVWISGVKQSQQEWISKRIVDNQSTELALASQHLNIGEALKSY